MRKNLSVFFQNLLAFINNKEFRKHSLTNLLADFFGGSAAMLVALPSAIAFGLIIYAPLGQKFSGQAAIGGIMGTIAVGLIAPLFGGTKRLISAPCAPAAAVLSTFVAELSSKGGAGIPLEIIPIYITLVSFFAGIMQFFAGKMGGGKFIKYIPYPVVAGYLSGVGVLIFIGQFPKLLGIDKSVNLTEGLMNIRYWHWESITIGTITICVMVAAGRFIKMIPGSIMGLIAGITTYFIIALINPALLKIENNNFIIGTISASLGDIVQTFIHQWSLISKIDFSNMGVIIVPFLTLATLLSMDTLKTCVVLDALTQTRHDSNRELIGQGLGNITSAIVCGIPGAGTMGATLVNLNSGAKSSLSGIFVGVSSIFVLFLLGKLIAWIPLSALAGILIVVASRMVDFKSFALLKHRSTFFDFFVILAVVAAAVSFSLLTAAGVGIALAIVLFLREQMRSSVIRRKVFGNQVFSKKVRRANERNVLEKYGSRTIVLELQGQLFFGTTDQLFSELEPLLKNCSYVILEMHRVQSVDYTAVNMLKQILARLKKLQGHLIFASVPLSLSTGRNVKKYLETLGLTETDYLKFFDDLDSALEWAEDDLLTEQNSLHISSGRVLDLNEIELLSGFSKEALDQISEYLVERNVQPGESVFKKGENCDEIYFIRKGLVKIILPLDSGMSYHLATFSKGGFFGDLSFLDSGERSADAIASEEVFLSVLTRSKFDEFSKLHPEIAGKFFERLASVIALRLRQSNIQVKTLQEN